MNHNDVIYTQTDSALNRFFAKIYGLVGVGIGLSALVSFLMLYVFTDNMINIIICLLCCYLFRACFGFLS